MMEKFGYTVGASIACATVALAIYTGMLYERHTAPVPCITNLSIYSYPNFEWEQIMLDDIVDYSEDSDFYRHGIQTSEELAEMLVEMSQESNWPSSIYTNPQDGSRYYVPGLCYVGKTDWLGVPTLYLR